MIFVTGTDTGIGKTVVSAALTYGLNAYYWKPIQSGFPTDTQWVMEKTGLPPDRFFPEAYRLKEALSPHAAAQLDGIEIDLKQILLPVKRPLIVEGAGGVMVPLNGKELMVDLIKQLKLPVLIVARSTLGTLNHTLMTLETLRRYKIPILGVVLNGPKNPGNKAAIEYYGKIEVVGEIEPMDTIDLQKVFNSFNLNNKLIY